MVVSVSNNFGVIEMALTFPCADGVRKFVIVNVARKNGWYWVQDIGSKKWEIALYRCEVIRAGKVVQRAGWRRADYDEFFPYDDFLCIDEVALVQRK